MLSNEDKWAAVHAYRKAVAHGDAPVIKCPECEGELVPVVAKDSGPALRCLSCRIVFEPGLHVWQQIQANIREVIENVRNRDIE